MHVLETDRLVLRWLEASDAQFILELLNDPTWLEYLPDKGVRSLHDARQYIEHEPRAMYAACGHGLNLVQLKQTGEALGICGLLKRDTLEDVDLGFAFLGRHQRRGYGLESSQGVLAHGLREFGYRRVVAITSEANRGSGALLERLGFAVDGAAQLDGFGEGLVLYVTELA